MLRKACGEGLQVPSEENLVSNQRRVKGFIRILLGAFDEHCNFGLYFLNQHLTGGMV